MAVSAAAKATAPQYPAAGGYRGANEMLEGGDMSVFMARVRSDYAAKKNSGAWGFMIIDALAANDLPLAQEVLDAMASKPSPEILSAVHLKPWVLAFAGNGATAQTEMAQLRRLMPADYRARPEQVVLFTVTAWDVNCPQHIPQRFEAADVSKAIESRDRRIAALEAEIARLGGGLPPGGG